MVDLKLEEGRYETCQMCGRPEIRFVHVMRHPNVSECFNVGCVCAEKMSDDYKGPKARESKLISRAAQRARWLTRKGWKLSSKGHPYINVKGVNLGVKSINNRWMYRIGDRFSSTRYNSMDEAKLALFDDWIQTQVEDR